MYFVYFIGKRIEYNLLNCEIVIDSLLLFYGENSVKIEIINIIQYKII